MFRLEQKQAFLERLHLDARHLRIVEEFQDIENWNAGGRGGELSPEEVRTMLQTLKKKKDCGKVTRHLESGDNLWDEFSKQRSILESEGDCSGFRERRQLLWIHASKVTAPMH